MAGLDPAIHHPIKIASCWRMEARVKPGHDELLEVAED